MIKYSGKYPHNIIEIWSGDATNPYYGSTSETSPDFKTFGRYCATNAGEIYRIIPGPVPKINDNARLFPNLIYVRQSTIRRLAGS